MSLSSKNVTDYFISNPFFPYTFFPYSKKDQRVGFGILYDDNLESSEINELCVGVKQSLQLKHLDFGFYGGRCSLTIHKDDLTKVYEIIKVFTKQGHKIFIQDSTQVSFDKEHQINPIVQESLLLKSVQQLFDIGMRPWDLVNLPVYLDKFWSNNDGKAFAKMLVEKYPELLNLDYITTGEALMKQAEIQSQSQSQHQAQNITSLDISIPDDF